MKYTIQVRTAFGLEAIVRREMEALGLKDIVISDGHLEVEGDLLDVARLNIWLRTADRVKIVFGRFKALTFTELFDQVYELPWEKILTVDSKFPVDGRSYKSKLFSISDCQSITKKAIVDKMKKVHNISWFEETGTLFPIEVAMRNDIASITIDTSGDSLHKRGYRKSQGTAPLKETLAAAMISLSFWNPERTLHDPFCGSGTIPIEAAMVGRNMAPGLDREFAAEKFSKDFEDAFIEAKREAFSSVDFDRPLYILGSDIDYRQILNARDNAANIGLEEDITFFIKDIEELDLIDKYGVCVTNPPYGERLTSEKEAEKLIKILAKKFNEVPTWSVYALSPISNFEKLYGREADRRRKLFNGDLQVDYYQYYGPRPPKGYRFIKGEPIPED